MGFGEFKKSSKIKIGIILSPYMEFLHKKRDFKPYMGSFSKFVHKILSKVQSLVTVQFICVVIQIVLEGDTPPRADKAVHFVFYPASYLAYYVRGFQKRENSVTTLLTTIFRWLKKRLLF